MTRLLKVRILGNEHFIKSKPSHYSHIEFNQAMSLFFPRKYKYELVNENEKADICIIGIQHENNHLIRNNEFNIFITVENLSVGRNHYKHFNKFNRYNNKKIHLYYYNDIAQTLHNSIPIPLCFIKQYNYLESIEAYKNILNTPFEHKRFCLAISKNWLNPNKINIIRLLSKVGNVEHISGYNHYILNKSCYNSIELLRVLNQYKFIICFENSKTNNYITEKIFNIFLAKSIPIYDGAQNISDYISEYSFINYDKYFLNKVMVLSNNKDFYNMVINKPKINTENINVDKFENTLEMIFEKNLNMIM